MQFPSPFLDLAQVCYSHFPSARGRTDTHWSPSLPILPSHDTGSLCFSGHPWHGEQHTLLAVLLVPAARLCGCLQNGVLFTKISKETEADNARVFLTTQPQRWGQDKGSRMQRRRGIEGINWAPATDFSAPSPEEVSFRRHPCPYEPTWKGNRQEQYIEWRKDDGYNLHVNKKSNMSIFKWHRNVTTEHVKPRSLSFYHNSSCPLLPRDTNW